MLICNLCPFDIQLLGRVGRFGQVTVLSWSKDWVSSLSFSPHTHDQEDTTKTYF